MIMNANKQEYKKAKAFIQEYSDMFIDGDFNDQSLSKAD